MKEIKQLNGQKGVGGILDQITLILSLYIFPGLMVACAIALAFVYLYVTIKSGAIYILLVFMLMILVRWAVSKIVSHPELPFFAKRPWLYHGLLTLNRVMIVGFRFVGKLHALHGKGVAYGAAKLKELPLKGKIAVALGVMVTLIPLSMLITVTTVNEIGKKLPYGKKRFEMTTEELAKRKQNRIEQAKFAVWGKPAAIEDAKCMDKYKTLLSTEAAKNGISVNRFEGQMFVEGSCKPDLVNTKSGAAGFAQIMLDVGCERGLVLDKAFCAEVLASNGPNKIRFIPKNKNIEDRRLNTAYAIPAAADILGDSARYWGNENWAFVQYHMGQGNQRKLIMDYLDETVPGWRTKYPKADFNNLYRNDPDRVLPKAVLEAKISYDDIFFRVTPDKTPKSYKRLFSLNDSSAWYVYTGLAATEGFTLMRSNYSAFAAMVNSQHDPDGGSANRPMRAWWSNTAAHYQTRPDVIAAYGREVFPVANNSNFGFVLRTTGADRIGECDTGHESAYYYTRKATAGLIYLIFSRTKEYGADPYEVTGLIRTNDMYDKPLANGKGCLPPTQPRTHVIGSAFDIGANIKGKPMSKKTRDALEFVLMDLQADGLLDRIKEGSADHIAYNPDFEKTLESVYDEVLAGGSPLIQ